MNTTAAFAAFLFMTLLLYLNVQEAIAENRSHSMQQASQSDDELANVLKAYGNCIVAHEGLEYRMRFNPTRYAGFSDEIGLSEELGDNFELADKAAVRCAAEVGLNPGIDKHIESNPLSRQDIQDIALLLNTCIDELSGTKKTGRLNLAALNTLDDIYAIEHLKDVQTSVVFECRDHALYGEWKSFPD